MKKELLIINNLFNKNFFNFLEDEFDLIFVGSEFNKKLFSKKSNKLFFVNQKTHAKDLFNLSSDRSLYLVLENINLDWDLNKHNVLRCPVSASKFKDKIYEIFYYYKEGFADIEIEDLKIINTINSKEALLTSPEKNILSELIKNNTLSKKLIEKNILNIRSGVITNSLDSHLTRIRRKLNSVDSKIKIITKESKILIQ